MNKTILFLLLIEFISIACKSNENFQIPKDSNSEIVKIYPYSDNLYIIEDYNYWKTNSLLYKSKEYIYFFSTGWSKKSARQILWKAKTYILPFKGIYIIAPQMEFINGLGEFIEEEIPVFIHKEAYSYLINNWKVEQLKYTKTFSTWEFNEMPLFTEITDNINFIEDQIWIFYPGKILIPGNLIVYFPKEKVIYGGNLLISPGEFQIHQFNIDKKRYIDFIHKIQKLDIETIIAGKGKAVHSKEILKEILNYLNI